MKTISLSRFSRILTTLTVFVLLVALTTVPAFADTSGGKGAPGSAAPVSPTTELETWEAPDWADDLDKVVKPYGSGFLYWARLSVDATPELVYDAGMGATYLSFKLDSACKLAECFSHYRTTFLLQYNLDQLIQLNDINAAIWEKPEWRQRSIGSQLSAGTVAKLKGGDYDAYGAIQIIKESSEYENDPKLSEQVRYHECSLARYTEDVMDGIKRLSVCLPRIEEDATPAEVIATVQKILEDNPELGILEEVRSIVYKGTTSNYLATLQALGAEKCDELWAKVSGLPSDFLHDEVHWLENYRVVICLPA